MGQVNIGGTLFDIYGEASDANDYFKAHSNGQAWRDAATVDKNRALVTASRSFDRTPWVGKPTDTVTPQPLAWPRVGTTDRNGDAVPDDVIPDDILEGNWEWALDTIQNAAETEETPGTNTRRTKVREKVDVIETENETEYFRPTIGQAPRFPRPVLELVGPFLAGQDATAVFTSGTQVEPAITEQTDDYGFNGTGVDGGSNA